MVFSIEAEILDINGPDSISVRLLSKKDAFCNLQKDLDKVYSSIGHKFAVPPGQKPIVGESYTIKTSTAWYRGKVVKLKTNNMLEVYLVDVGKSVDCDCKSLFKLVPPFLEETALSFFVHLSQIPENWKVGEETVNVMRSMFKDQEAVNIIRRAPPIFKSGHWSLPVEISFSECDGSNPFLPNTSRIAFLSQKLLASNTVRFAEEFDDTEEDESNSELSNDEKKITVSPMIELKKTQMPNFHWVQPVMPREKSFHARATFVDDAGQIYMHLHDQRHQFRLLRKKVHDFYQKSLPDCPLESYSQEQEVIALYNVDKMWYRARFLDYVPDSNYERCHILFVDWGNTAVVKTANVRSVIFVGLKEPIFAIRAVLHNVVPIGNCWSPESADFLLEKVLYTFLNGNNNIRVQVMSENDRQPLLVSISLISPLSTAVDCTEGNTDYIWIDLADVLVRKGLARFADVSEVEEYNLKSRSVYDYGIGFKYFSEMNSDSLTQSYNKSSSRKLNKKRSVLEAEPSMTVKCVVRNIICWGSVVVNIMNDNNSACISYIQQKMQELCDDMPAIIRPSEGLTVAMKRSSEGGWCRAEILKCKDAMFKVHVVDWGVTEWVSNTRELKQIPRECEQWPAQARILKLPLKFIEEEEIATALMTECIRTKMDKEMVVEVVSHQDTLCGHLLDLNGNIIYQSLINELVVSPL